jgi:hypothetical protein
MGRKGRKRKRDGSRPAIGDDVPECRGGLLVVESLAAEVQ